MTPKRHADARWSTGWNGWSRRSVLRALGAGAALPALGGVGAAHGSGETEPETDVVVDFANYGPENLTADDDGNIYTSIALTGEIRQLPAERTDESGLGTGDTERVATLPRGDGFLAGVVAGDDDALYACLASFDGSTHGVWEVPLDDDSSPKRLTAFSIRTLPNGILFHDERLLVTESFGGTVLEIDPGTGSRTILTDDESLDPDTSKTIPVGANGLAVADDGDVFVSNRDFGRIVRVPVTDGSAGTPETVVENRAELEGADGIVFDDGGHLYVAVNQQNKVSHVTEKGALSTLTTADALDFPTDVGFVRPEGSDRDELFVTNLAIEGGDPNLLRADVGVDGDVE